MLANDIFEAQSPGCPYKLLDLYHINDWPSVIRLKLSRDFKTADCNVGYIPEHCKNTAAMEHDERLASMEEGTQPDDMDLDVVWKLIYIVE